VPEPTATSRFLDLYGRLFENCADGVILGKPDGTILAANPVACRLLRRAEAEIIHGGRQALAFEPDVLRALLATRAREGVAKATFRQRAPEGATVVVEVTSAIVPGFEGESFSYTILRDVSESDRVRKQVEASEERFRQVLDASSDGFWEHDITSRRIHFSARTSEILGLPPGDSSEDERDFLGRIHPDDRARGVRIYASMVEGAVERFDSDYRICDEGGCWRWVRSRGKVITRTEGGAPLRVAGTLSDIHARKVAEEALQAREAKLRAFFDSPAVGISITSGDNQILEVNDRFCAMLGYSREELAELTWPEITHPDDAAVDVARVRRMAAGEIDSFATEKRYVRKDGSHFWSLTSVSCSRADDGSILWAIAIVKDITSRKAAEGRYRELYEGLPDGFVQVALDGRILEMNEAYCRMVGYTADELRSMTYQELTPERWRADEARVIGAQVLGRGWSDVYEKEYRRKDGSAFPVDLRAFLVREGGKPSSMWAVVRDVSDRKRAEDELRRSEARLARVLEGSSDGHFEIDGATRRVAVSPRYVEIMGLPPGTTEFPLDDLMARCPPEDIAWMGKDILAIQSGAIDRFDWEHRVRVPDGSVRWVHARGKVIERNPDGKAVRISGTVSDIQARKGADEALRASEARFRSLAEDAPVGIFETDTEGRSVYLNGAAARMMFLPGARAIGSAWEENLHPEDRARAMREWYEAARAGRPIRIECRFQDREGTITRVQAHATPVHDATGRHTGHVGFLLDVTEERRLEANVAASGRLAALGTLVSGVAHEVNNPLAGALASQGVAIEEVREIREALGGASPAGREDLDRRLAAVLEALTDAQASGQRIARIVRDLNVLGRPDPRRSAVRIGGVVEEALRWLPGSVAANASIRVDLKEVPAVMASPGQLQQVIVNLVTNAAKSIPEGRRGRVTIRVGPGEPGMARVEVQDDGAGMRPEVLQRMFDPFYTTRAVGQGIGLGLPICHAIVTAHGGTITATSEAGAGSTFRVELPVVST